MQTANEEFAPPPTLWSKKGQRSLTYYVQLDRVTPRRTDWIGDLTLIPPESSFLTGSMLRLLLFRDSFILSVSSRLWPLKSQWMEILVSFEEQFRDTESSSLTVVLPTWMEGVVTGSVDKQKSRQLRVFYPQDLSQLTGPTE